MKNLIILIFLTGMIFISAQETEAQSDSTSISKMINYQGFLTDQDGKALTGNYNIIFRLYPDTNIAANWVWSEEQTVAVENGLYSVLLGSSVPMTAEKLNNNKFLGITVKGELEMLPRLLLASVPFSFHSDKLDNKDAVDFVAVAGDTVTGPLVLTKSADLEVAGKTRIFGDRQILYNGATPLVTSVLVAGTADTDGFLIAVATYASYNANISLDGYIKINDNFIRFATAGINGVSGEDWPLNTNSFTMPVRTGEQWNVTLQIYSPNSVAQHALIYWIPLGNHP